MAKPPPASTAAAAAADPLRQPLAARAFPAPGGMDDCAKGTAVAGLYDDLMVDILARLPVKDVRRSKCVSKPWRDLIADPLHRKKLPQTLEGFFHGGGAGGRHSYGQFSSLSGSGERVPRVDPSFSFLTAKLPGVKRVVLLDSCNGLLLFGCRREGKFGYIVCNPATEELVTVPASSSSCPPPPPLEKSYDDSDRCAHTFLMFDPAVSSHFSLFQIWENMPMEEVESVRSYSSETRAWSDRSSKWKRGEKGGEWGLWGKAIVKSTFGRALVNGLLHFIVYHVQKQEALVVAVDAEGKTYGIIPWHDKHTFGDATFIGQSQGKLHCISVSLESVGYHIDLIYCTQVSVWVLEDYDTHEWILKHNESSSQIFGFPGCPVKVFDIVAIHPDHSSIFLVQHWNQKLVSYDMDSKKKRTLCTLQKGYRFITPYIPCFMESPVLATKD